MAELVWFAVFLNIAVPFNETTKFKDVDACEKFGAEMAPRAADYIRGALKLDWDDKIKIDFICAMPGQPT